MKNICFLKSCADKNCYNCLLEAVNTSGFIKEVDICFFPLIFKDREAVDQLREWERIKEGSGLWKDGHVRKAQGMFWLPAAGPYGCSVCPVEFWVRIFFLVKVFIHPLSITMSRLPFGQPSSHYSMPSRNIEYEFKAWAKQRIILPGLKY